MDELRSAIKGRTDRSVDKMVRATDSHFTVAVLECPVPSKFRLPQLEPFNGLKNPQDHPNTFKDRKSTRLNSSHSEISRMPSSA